MTIKHILLHPLAFTTIIQAADFTAEHPWDKTHADYVWRKNLDSLPHQNHGWSSWTLEEYAINLYKEITNPVARRKRTLAFNVFKSEDAAHGTAGLADKTNEQVWHDLTLLCGQTDLNHYVAKTAFPTITEVGIVNTCLMLTKPTTNTTTLTEQQELIKTVAANNELRSALEHSLQDFAQHEHVLINFWDERDHLGTSVNRMVYFDKNNLDFLNTNESVLQLKGLTFLGGMYTQCAIQMVACCVLGLYGCFKLAQAATPEPLNEGAKRYVGNAGSIFSTLQMIDQPTIQGLVALIASAMCGYYAVDGYTDQISGIRAYLNTMCKITQQMALTMRSLNELINTLDKHSLLNDPTCKTFKLVHSSIAMQQFFQLAQQACFDTEDAAVSLRNMGMVLAFLKHFFNYKPIIQAAITKLGYIDTMTACAKNIVDQPDRWCVPAFVKNDTPYIVADNFWHPLIKGNPITSSLTLGTDGNRPHAVITGPNEGGKSTTMKAVALAALCGQTVGICPAKSFFMTPFAYIKTYLNINDDIGAGNSLFRAEFKRAQELVDTISTAKPGEFGLFVFDEMCSGTSPVEGAAAAYIIAKRLSNFNNCLCLVATHFANMTNLEFDTTTFKNYNVRAIQRDDGSFTYPRILEEGPSNQHIALDILRNEGFAGSLIDEARDMVRSMTLTM